VEAQRKPDLRGWLRHLAAGHPAVPGHIGLFQVSMSPHSFVLAVSWRIRWEQEKPLVGNGSLVVILRLVLWRLAPKTKFIDGKQMRQWLNQLPTWVLAQMLIALT